MDGKPPPANSDVIAAEQDHRIANHLGIIASLLRVEASRLPDGRGILPEDVRALLKGTAAKIEGIGRLYRLLSLASGADQVDLAAYIHDLVDVATSSLTMPNQVSVTVEACSGISVSSGDAAAIGLFVEEAITNSLKYAHPTGVMGEIIVDCQINGPGGFVIEVADDGVGFPEGFDPHTNNSFGVRLMRSLATQIGAEIEFIAEGTGLSIRLIKPSIQQRAA
jgi:two-component sensor histidine kinase